MTFTIERLYLAFLLLAFGSTAFAGSRATQVSGLCLQHVGMSDKPIFPLVIVADDEAAQRCKEFLGTEGSSAGVYKVSLAELRQIADRTAQVLATSRKPKDEKGYGTFKLIIIGKRSRKQSMLSRENTLRLIGSLLELSDNSELSIALRTTRTRLTR